MSKATGIVLIAAGLAVGAYVLPSGDLTEADLAHVADVSKVPAADTSIRPIVVPEPKPAVRPAQAAAEPVPPFSAPIVVTIAQRPSEPAAMPAKAAPMPRDRDAIGRELQKELRRVGCYDGELNGVWTPSTRQAMKAFMDRVNASLPTDEPDSILLTMVRGYQDRVCGKLCPAGQGLGDGGRCVPNAILVRAAPKPPAPVAVATPAPSAAQKPVPAITSWTTTTTATAPTPPTGAPPPEGRMALAGPQAPADPVAPAAEQPPPQAAPTPPPAAAKRPPRPSGQGDWARNLFRGNHSFN